MKGRVSWVVIAVSATTAACASRPPEQAGAPKATPEGGFEAANDIPDPVDKCPDEPEDRDDFEDEDGCPDPDPIEAIGALELPVTACVLATDRWDGTKPVTELGLSAGGPIYALATQPSAQLYLGVGPSDVGQVVDFEESGVLLRGILKSDAFTLHAKKPLVFGGFVIPAPYAVLRWTAARDGEVVTGFELGPGVEAAEPLGANVPCSDVAVNFASFEPEAALGDVSKATDAQLRLGHPIDLRTQPGGKVVAKLTPKDDEDSLLKVFGSSGRSKRIFWWRDNGVVFGWVAASELRPRTVGLTGYGVGHGGPVLPKSKKILEALSCNQDLELVAEAEGKRAKVGKIMSGTVFDVLARAHDFVSVQPRAKHLAPAPKAKLLVGAQDVASCAPENSGEGPK